MENTKKLIEENKSYIFIGIASLAAGYLVYKKMLNSSQDKSKPTLGQEIAAKMTFNEKHSYLMKQIKELLNQSQNTLTPQVLKAIYSGQYYLAQEQAKVLILNSRNERRANIDSKEQYAMVVMKNQKQLQELMDKHLGGILAYFNIDKQIWIQQTGRWSSSSEEADEQWQDLIKSEEDKLFASIRNFDMRPLNFSTIKSILQFKVQKLKATKAEDLSLDTTTDQASKFAIVQSFIKDCVYQKYKIQEEDLEHSFLQLSQSDKNKLQELYDKINEEMTNFIYDEQEKLEQRQFVDELKTIQKDQSSKRVSSSDSDYY